MVWGPFPGRPERNLILARRWSVSVMPGQLLVRGSSTAAAFLRTGSTWRGGVDVDRCRSTHTYNLRWKLTVVAESACSTCEWEWAGLVGAYAIIALASWRRNCGLMRWK